MDIACCTTMTSEVMTISVLWPTMPQETALKECFEFSPEFDGRPSGVLPGRRAPRSLVLDQDVPCGHLSWGHLCLQDGWIAHITKKSTVIPGKSNLLIDTPRGKGATCAIPDLISLNSYIVSHAVK